MDKTILSQFRLMKFHAMHQNPVQPAVKRRAGAHIIRPAGSARQYEAFERPANEQRNRILRRFMSKAVSINGYTGEAILMFADKVNAPPKKRLCCQTPEELFEQKLGVL